MVKEKGHHIEDVIFNDGLNRDRVEEMIEPCLKIFIEKQKNLIWDLTGLKGNSIVCINSKKEDCNYIYLFDVDYKKIFNWIFDNFQNIKTWNKENIKGDINKEDIIRINNDNFDQYMKAVKHMFFSKGKRFSLTRSAFLMSKRTTIHNSGLAIEIEPAMDYSDDGSKAFIYHDSPNYDFYMQALRKFGFMSDKDYPGRIIADLGSPKMQEYMAFYELTLENVFDAYYYKASDYDYELIRVYLIQFYNNYASLYPVKSETTGRSGWTCLPCWLPRKA